MNKLFITTLIILIAVFSCSKKEAAVKPVEADDTAAMLSKANELYKTGDVQNAFRVYGLIYEQYPTSSEYVDAAIGLSRCYNDLGDYEKGMDLLYNLVRENIIPSRVPEIYDEMAKYYEINAGISTAAGLSDETADFKKAMDFYQKAVYYPNSDDKNAKAYAQYRIGELNINMLNFKDALLAFKTTVLNYPDTHWATVAGQRIEEFKDAVDNVIKEETAPENQGTSPGQYVAPTSSDSEATTPTDTTSGEIH